MSWTAETCVVVGYKIPQEAATNAWELIENDWKTYGRWEDFLVDPDPVSGSDYLFFGKIIFRLREDAEPVRFEDILFTQKDFDEVNEGFKALFGDWCANRKYYTKFDKWLMIRYT